MQWYYEVIGSSLRESLVFVAGCAVVALAGSLVLNVSFFDGFGLVLLVVSAGLMLIGGSMSFVTPGNARLFNDIASVFGRKPKSDLQYDYKAAQHTAALYSLTGVLLFAYSLLLGLTVG